MTRELLYFEIGHSLLEEIQYLEKKSLKDESTLILLSYLLAKKGKSDYLGPIHKLKLDALQSKMGESPSKYQRIFDGIKSQADELDRIYNLNWDHIKQKIDSYSLRDYRNTRIYQDSFPEIDGSAGMTTNVLERIYNIAPVYWAELERKKDLGSRNAETIEFLLEKGAIFEGSENKKELQTNHIYFMDLMPILKKIPLIKKKVGKFSEMIARERDKPIARKIDQTLKEEELGIVFMGSIHKVTAYLPEDIEIDYVPIFAELT